MNQPSYQQLSFHQQIISLNQSYPCPRCASHGSLEAYGLTETLKCTSCDRSFVPLRGGRLLCPANRMGCKVAPTFWWDGLRWHCAGTTASTRQVMAMISMLLSPLLLLNIALSSNLWAQRPDFCSPLLMTAVVGFFTVLTLYSTCWDSYVRPKRKA